MKFVDRFRAVGRVILVLALVCGVAQTAESQVTILDSNAAEVSYSSGSHLNGPHGAIWDFDYGRYITLDPATDFATFQWNGGRSGFISGTFVDQFRTRTIYNNVETTEGFALAQVDTLSGSIGPDTSVPLGLSNGNLSIRTTYLNFFDNVNSYATLRVNSTRVDNRQVEFSENDGTTNVSGRLMRSVPTTLSDRFRLGGGGSYHEYTHVSIDSGTNSISSTQPGTFGITSSLASMTFDGSIYLNVGLIAEVDSTGQHVGHATFLPQGEGLTGESVRTFDVPYDIEVLDNRTITANNGNTVDLGRVLTDTTVQSGAFDLVSTGDRSHFTDIRVLTTTDADLNPIDGDINLNTASGNTETFNASMSRQAYLLGTFATPGERTGTVVFTPTGEGLAGEAVNSIDLNYTIDVLAPATVALNNESPLGAGDSAGIGNSDSDFNLIHRAAMEIANITMTSSDIYLDGFNIGDTMAVGEGLAATVVVDETGYLNGSVIEGEATLTMQNDQTVTGAVAGDLGDHTWELRHTVENIIAGQGQSSVEAGGSFAGLGLTSTAQTQATILEGTSVTGPTTVEMEFTDPTGQIDGLSIRNDAARIGDVLKLTGTDGDMIVLAMTYDDQLLTSSEEDSLFLAWFDGEAWVNAIEGNFGESTAQFVEGGFEQAYYSLGYYGLDTSTNTVWAVIDHNSSFAVIPEPSTALLLLAGSGLLWRRRR